MDIGKVDILSRSAWTSNDILFSGGLYLGMSLSEVNQAFTRNELAGSPQGGGCGRAGCAVYIRGNDTSAMSLSIHGSTVSSIQYGNSFSATNYVPPHGYFSQRFIGKTRELFVSCSDALANSALGKPCFVGRTSFFERADWQYSRVYDQVGVKIELVHYFRGGKFTPPELISITFYPPKPVLANGSCPPSKADLAPPAWWVTAPPSGTAGSK